MEKSPFTIPSCHQDAFDRIWSHSFENDDLARDLVKRIALEQRWTLDKTRAAVLEYRKFCFLFLVSDHAVTPSVEVDAVWHTHLLYTRDYWDVFCKDVLKTPLHHGPTKGGQAEQSRFYDQYAKTLASYAKYFGRPPEEFWPKSSKRFEKASNWRTVYTPDYLVMKNPLASVKNYFKRRNTK